MLEFARKYMQLTTLKQILPMLQVDLPKLLGFEQSTLFVYDDRDSICAVAIDEKGEREKKKNAAPGWEREFLVDAGNVVKFPTSLGITGFCFKNDAVCSFTSHDNAEKKGVIFSQGSVVKPSRTEECWFNAKIDDFMDVQIFRNAVYIGLNDDDPFTCTRPVGVLQLVNRADWDDISQEDLLRCFSVRKLLGAQT
jgi:hypothetical protein